MNVISAQSAAALRKFIKDNPGTIAAIRDSAPKCEGSTVEQSAMTGQRRQGWQDAVAFIFAISEESPEGESAGYVS